MTIGIASLNDLPAIMEYSKQAHSKSVTYFPLGYNSVIWRRSVKEALADPSMVVFVSKRGAAVVGLLVGMKMPAPWFAGFCASDLVFVADRDGDKLLEAFVAWCKQKKVRRIDMGVSEPGDEQAKDRLFRSEGFQQAGRVYYMIIEEVPR